MRIRLPKNLGWKFGSLLASVLLWLAISVTPDVVTHHTAPILYRNLSKDLMVIGDSPDELHVELRGPSRDLTSGALGDTVAMLDLASVKTAGERTFTISDTNLSLPPGVTFLRAVPSQLRLRFARMATKDVPVEIRFTGALPSGYKIKTRGVAPERLRIAGAEERIAAVNSVQTDTVDLNHARGSGTYLVDAFIADPQVHFESSPKVIVTLDIERN